MEKLNETNATYNRAGDVDLSLMFKDIPSFMYIELTIVCNFAGAIFNIILITYFIKMHKYRSPTFMILTCLAVLDMMSCVFCALWSGLLFPTMPFPEVGYGCHILLFFGILGKNASEYHLVFFAALRFYQLAFPLRAKVHVTSTFVLKVCILLMISVSSTVLPLVIMYGTKSVIMHGKRVTICTLSGNRYAYDIGNLIINTIVPCVAIVVLHIAKYIAVSRSAALIATEQQNRQNADARAVTIIIILFFMAWFPAYIYTTIQHSRIENYRKMRDSMYLVLLYIIFSNSTLNPIVYCFASKTVRDDVLKLLCPRRYLKNNDLTK